MEGTIGRGGSGESECGWAEVPVPAPSVGLDQGKQGSCRLMASASGRVLL